MQHRGRSSWKGGTKASNDFFLKEAYHMTQGRLEETGIAWVWLAGRFRFFCNCDSFSTVDVPTVPFSWLTENKTLK